MLLDLGPVIRDACEADDDSAATVAVGEMRGGGEARRSRERPLRERAELVRIEMRAVRAVSPRARLRRPTRAAPEQRIDLSVEALFHLKLADRKLTPL